MKMKISFLTLFFVLASCRYIGHGDAVAPRPPKVLGFSYSEAAVDFDEAYGILRNAIDTNPNINIVAEVNHSENANTVNLELDPTRIILFGNPNLGTPLMQRNQLAGLDLPQKILVYQNKRDAVYLGFNNTTYLSSRHGLDGVPTLPTIENALTNLTTAASGDVLVIAERSTVPLGAGIITKTSNLSFDETYDRLKTTLENNPNLGIVAEVNHGENASNAGLELRPTRLIIFGNPNLGTPIMQTAQTTALDLPQKMLVWEDENANVNISYNSPYFLAMRHRIKGNRQVLRTIAMALDNISNGATGN